MEIQDLQILSMFRSVFHGALSPTLRRRKTHRTHIWFLSTFTSMFLLRSFGSLLVIDSIFRLDWHHLKYFFWHLICVCMLFVLFRFFFVFPDIAFWLGYIWTWCNGSWHSGFSSCGPPSPCFQLWSYHGILTSENG